MLQSVESFAAYFESIRRRTLNYLKTIPADRAGWKPLDGEFSLLDLVFHLAEAEKMFIHVFVAGRWTYHPKHPETGLTNALAYLEQTHTECMAALRRCADTSLQDSRPTLDGPQIKAWRVLMMLVEHEVHHRSQIAMYLALMGIEPPQIYGLSLEDVIARTTG